MKSYMAQMLARSEFSHKALIKLNNNELQEKLQQERKINWSKLPIMFKRGSYVIKENDEWIVDFEIPEFSKNREYVESLIKFDE